MQHTPLEIKDKLLKAVDKEYNVLDMGTVVEVISILERTPITKEALELPRRYRMANTRPLTPQTPVYLHMYDDPSSFGTFTLILGLCQSTRLGKYINELRRKTTNGALARRAKELVRQWRHLIAQPDNSSASVLVSSSSNHIQNGLMPTGHLGENVSPGLSQNITNVSSQISVSPPLRGVSAANANIPISPAMSVASSGRSSSPCLQFQQSSTLVRHKVKKHTCPSSPVAYNSQNRTHTILRPESPGLTLSPVNQVIASDSVPKTHVANKRLRKDLSPPPTSCAKLGQANGGLINNINLDVVCPSVEIVEECSGDSLGATSDHGSVTYLSESHALLQNEVPQDNGLHFKNINRCPNEVTAKGTKMKNSFPETSQIPSVDDIVKEKIASIARTPKVKTTQELLADLQAKMVPSEDHVSVNSIPTGSRTSLSKCTLPHKHGCPSDALEISRNKTEHIAKFLRSHSELQELPREQTMSEMPKNYLERLPLLPPNTDRAAAVSRFPCNFSQSNIDRSRFEKSVSSKNVHNVSSGVLDCVNEEVTNILSCLPPIKYDEIQWEDEQDLVNKKTSTEVTEPLVTKLYSESVEGITGNYSNEINGVIFREWHETVVRPSYQENLLSILPYVIID